MGDNKDLDMHTQDSFRADLPYPSRLTGANIRFMAERRKRIRRHRQVITGAVSGCLVLAFGISPSMKAWAYSMSLGAEHWMEHTIFAGSVGAMNIRVVQNALGKLLPYPKTTSVGHWFRPPLMTLAQAQNKEKFQFAVPQVSNASLNHQVALSEYHQGVGTEVMQELDLVYHVHPKMQGENVTVSEQALLRLSRGGWHPSPAYKGTTSYSFTGPRQLAPSAKKVNIMGQSVLELLPPESHTAATGLPQLTVYFYRRHVQYSVNGPAVDRSAILGLTESIIGKTS
ncbi:MAG: hypothetical protein ACYCVB_14955 [Bacilli bacterium]